MASTALQIKTETVDIVASRVREFMQSGELNLPANYSPENALKSAWLILQNAQTTDKKMVLSTCSKASIANALLDMVIQGLNPAKHQCYFIPYGSELACQRSYHGTMALAMRADPTIEDIVAEIVYEGDVLDYRINRGHKEIVRHEQTLESVDSGKIRAAYCAIYYQDGRQKTTIMTIAEIHKSWKQSRMNPFDEKGNVKATGTHGKFPAEMAKRTVIGRACKPIVNSSDDSYLFREASRRSDEIATDHEVNAEIEAHANGAIIDIPEGHARPSQEDEAAQEPETEERQGEASRLGWDDAPPSPGF